MRRLGKLCDERTATDAEYYAAVEKIRTVMKEHLGEDCVISWPRLLASGEWGPTFIVNAHDHAETEQAYALIETRYP